MLLNTNSYTKPLFHTLIITGSDKGTDMHAIIQVVPIVALYAGRPEMLERVVEAVSVTMTADEAIVHSLVAAR